MKTHAINPLRPARTLCNRKVTECKTGESSDCKVCQTGLARLAALGPELVAYWAGSISSSVQNCVDNGQSTVIHI